MFTRNPTMNDQVPMSRLTDREAMIWAAAFVHRGAGSYVAVEVAAHAVEEARRLAVELRERPQAIDPAAARMLREMVDREGADMDEDRDRARGAKASKTKEPKPC